MGKQILLKNVRFSFVRVFEAENRFDKSKPEYSVVLLVPKSDKDLVNLVRSTVKELLTDFFARNPSLKGKLPSKFHMPVQDGDDGSSNQEAYEGCLHMRAKKLEKDGRPVVIDGRKNPITSKEEIYSGSWGNASVDFYLYDKEGKQGIGIGLRGIQKTKDDESLGGGGGSAINDFDEDGDFDATDPLSDFDGGGAKMGDDEYMSF